MSEGQPVHVHPRQPPPTCEAGDAAIHTYCALTHPLKVFLCVRRPHLHDPHSCSAWRQRRQWQLMSQALRPYPLHAPICFPLPQPRSHKWTTITHPPTHPPSSSSSTISLDSQASASRMLSSCMNRCSVVMPAALYAPRSPADHGEHVWRCSPECQTCHAGSRQQHGGSQHSTHPSRACAPRPMPCSWLSTILHATNVKNVCRLWAARRSGDCPPKLQDQTCTRQSGQSEQQRSKAACVSDGRVSRVLGQHLDGPLDGSHFSHTLRYILFTCRRGRTCPTASPPCCEGPPAAQAVAPIAATLAAAAAGSPLLIAPLKRCLICTKLQP